MQIALILDSFLPKLKYSPNLVHGELGYVKAGRSTNMKKLDSLQDNKTNVSGRDNGRKKSLCNDVAVIIYLFFILLRP